MSLIDKVSAIVTSKKPIDEVAYLEHKVNYHDNISILNIDLDKIIPPPPKNSSLTTAKELEEISKATKSRTSSEIELISSVDKDPVHIFTDYLRRNNLTFPKEKFYSYYNIVEQYVFALKYHYNRARPEQLAPYYNLDINVLYTETHHTPAYPSGHTMYAELTAQILADQYPEHKEVFFKLSDYCGLARILQGVHYPSDNKASKIAINKLYGIIKELEDDKKSKELSIDTPRKA